MRKTYLLTAIHRIKHLSGNTKTRLTNGQRDFLRSAIRSLVRGETPDDYITPYAGRVSGARTKLKRIFTRGVALQQALLDTDLFQQADLPTSPGYWGFEKTLLFYYEAVRKSPPTSSDPSAWSSVTGYVAFRGRYIAKVDSVVGYDGEILDKHNVIHTAWGATSSGYTLRLRRSTLPRHLIASASKDYSALDVLEVPEGLLRGPNGLDTSRMIQVDGVLQFPDRKLGFTDIKLGQYHSSAKHLTPLDTLETGKIRIGLEMEMECLENRKRSATGVAVAKYLNKVVHPRYTLVESDSSVRNGFELVTSPASVELHKAAMLALCAKSVGKSDRVNPLLRCAPESARAGTHIHVDRRSVSNWLALSALFNTTGDGERDESYRHIMFGRHANNFCRSYSWGYDDDENKIASKYQHNSGKYYAINNSHSNTYEARVFSSSNNPAVLLGHIEIMQAAIEWTNTMLTVSKKRITAENFARYIMGNSAKYPAASVRAVNFLESAGYIKTKEVKLE